MMAERDPLAVGEVIRGRYEILEIAEHGRMEMTYRVADRESFGRSCIVRELIPGSESTTKIMRALEREARLLATLRHPGIPRLHAFFPEGNRYYLVQEDVGRHTLGDVVRTAGPLPEASVRLILQKVLEILDYLHGRSPVMVHRAIRPGSVVRADSGDVFLTDFGAVKDAVTQLESGAGQTTLLGSTEYMAPEQLRGRAEPASDLYALGATALHLLTGHPPEKLFDTREGQWRFDAVPGLSAGLRATLARMLEASPVARYRSAAEVLADLRRSSVPAPARARRKTASRRMTAPAVEAPANGATAVESPTTGPRGARPDRPEPQRGPGAPQRSAMPATTPAGPNRAKVIAIAVLVALGLWGIWQLGAGRSIGVGADRGGTDIGTLVAQLTQEAFVLVGSHGALVVSYPPGWVVSMPAGQQGGVIRVSAGDGSAMFEYSVTPLQGVLAPDQIVRDHILPRFQRVIQNVRVLRATPVPTVPVPTMMRARKSYLLSGVHQGRPVVAELFLDAMAGAGLGIPGFIQVPGTTVVTLYSGVEVVAENQPSRFPTILAMAVTALAIGPQEEPRVVKSTRESSAEWKRQVAEANCWATLFRRDKQTWLNRGAGVPDPELFDRSRCQ